MTAALIFVWWGFLSDFGWAGAPTFFVCWWVGWQPVGVGVGCVGCPTHLGRCRLIDNGLIHCSHSLCRVF